MRGEGWASCPPFIPVHANKKKLRKFLSTRIAHAAVCIPHSVSQSTPGGRLLGALSQKGTRNELPGPVHVITTAIADIHHAHFPSAAEVLLKP